MLMSRSFRRIIDHDWKVASVLFLLGLGTRIPFVSRMAFSSDSARFALALHHFDVTQMRPHAPGYILYVAFAKAFNFVLNDSTKSLVAVSVVSSAATVALAYVLSSRMYGRTSGLVCSVLLLTSPLFWYHGGMPLTYALEGALTLAFAIACYEVIVGNSSWLQPAAVLLGLSAGVRQTLLFLLAPLLLYAMSKCRARQIAFSVLLCAATCLAWFVPMIALSGGAEKYVSSMRAQYGTWVVVPLPLIIQAKIRSGILMKYLAYSLCLGVLPVLYYFGRMFAGSAWIRDERARFLILWLVPAVLFFIGVNIYNPGHIVFTLPAFFIVLGESIRTIIRDLEEGARSWAARMPRCHWGGIARKALWRKVASGAFVGVIAIVNVYIFFCTNGEVSYAEIKLRDRQLAAQVSVTEARFSAGHSMIVTCRSNTQAGLYLPEFLVCCPLPLIFKASDVPIEAQNVYMSLNRETTPKTYWIPTDFKIKPINIPNGIDTLIFWEEEIAGYCRNADRLTKVADSDPSDPEIFCLAVKPGEKLYYDYHFLRVD
jgi:hypothetical protein